MTRSVHRRLLTTVAAAVLAALALAGCSGGGDAGDSSSDYAVPGAADGGGGGESAEEGAGPEADGPGSAPFAPGQLARDVVVTADITVRTTDVMRDADRAVQQTTVAGGVVSGDIRAGDAESATADLVLRVPPNRVDSVLDGVAALGEELRREVTSEDVTAVKADLDSRVASQQASIDRLRALLAEAADLTDVIALEGELASREADLESLQAQQRALGDQLTLATISLHLVADAPPAEPDREGFLGGLAAGWDAFRDTGSTLLTALGAMLPFLAVVALIVGTVTVIYRRRRRVTADAPPPAPAA